ncbi:MAG: acireductone dioxygenase [Mizugakiibacter sp.]|uniref:1,2-dihydroxy-3-keto-5-methylthiopentene dioxygenase n=1 Tax=Mizugakiibacter sp. TaxID=1972610 RepID=UPI0031BCF2AC|nr:acireductone dioxygenase [Xanthomonadaceae bacterium]
MSRLRIFSETDGASPLLATDAHAEIVRELAAAGVRFERWQTSKPITPGASPDAVIAAYRGDIDRLMAEEGYRAADVVSLHANHPDKEALRRKFLEEHTHAEDEVRFFVAGSGLFSLHLGDRVYEILCTQGDLIGVPGGTRHWFDMGPAPHFVAIRLFTNPAGWVANFTGDPIAARFPRYE